MFMKYVLQHRFTCSCSLGALGKYGPMKTCFAVLNIMILCMLWHPVVAVSEGNEAKEEVSETLVYHTLSNEELLQQTENVFKAALNTFRSQMRGLAQSELLLEQARTDTEAFQMPETPEEAEGVPEGKDKESLEAAKIQTDHAKSRLDAYRQQLDLLQSEQALLGKNMEHIEQAQLATSSLIDTIAGLQLPLLEIRLRVGDGTLTQEQVPTPLQTYELETRRLELILLQETLKEKADAATQELQVDIARIDEAKAIAVEAESLYTSAEKRYTEELKRQELAQAYSGQTPQALLTDLSQLQAERVGLNGALQLSHTRFSRSQAEVMRLQQQIDALTPPEASERLKPGVAVRAEEVEQKIQQVNEIATYYTTHIKHLQQLEAALQTFIEHDNVYQGDITVLNDHLFRMLVPAEILEGLMQDGKVTEEVADDIRYTHLATAKSEALNSAEKALAASEQAKEQLGEIAEQIEKIQNGAPRSGGFSRSIEQNRRSRAASSAAGFRAEGFDGPTSRLKIYGDRGKNQR